MTTLDEKILKLRIQKDEFSILFNQLSSDEPYLAEKKAKYTESIEALDAGITALIMMESILAAEKEFKSNMPVTDVGAANAITFAKEANENRGFKCGATYIDWLSARSKTLSNLENICHSIADEKKIDDYVIDNHNQEDNYERE